MSGILPMCGKLLIEITLECVGTAFEKIRRNPNVVGQKSDPRRAVLKMS